MTDGGWTPAKVKRASALIGHVLWGRKQLAIVDQAQFLGDLCGVVQDLGLEQVAVAAVQDICRKAVHAASAAATKDLDDMGVERAYEIERDGLAATAEGDGR